MAEEVKIWQVDESDKLTEINRSKLNFEERLENWLHEDISILSPDLLVIGKQVKTNFGGIIDLLCINRKGDLVIVELKKDKTPREVTAQSLDYASWVKDLSHEKIYDLAESYFAKKETNLEEEFQQKFDEDLPEVLNESHGMLIVASEIDESTERIIKYLSDTYGVDINVASFQYFKSETGQEILARVFLIEQEEVEYKSQTKRGSKRKPNLTYEELEEIAKQNGIEVLYKNLVDGLEDKFYKGTTRSQINFKGNVFGKFSAILNLLPPKSNVEKGLAFEVYLERFTNYTGLIDEKAIEILPTNKTDWTFQGARVSEWSGYEGFFSNEQEVENFLNGLQNVVKQ